MAGSSGSARRNMTLLAAIGPGILVAATGVGAGDLATAAFTGGVLGLSVAWAVVLGAGLKFVLNEGLARWQLATGDTLLEGCAKHIGRPFQIVFLLYLLPWTFFVGSALISACGATAHALCPVFAEATDGKIFFGILHSILGVVLVRAGGFRLFEKVMGVCIAVMFVTVVVTAVLVRPDWTQVVTGLSPATVLEFDREQWVWVIALMGGVGGTLTVLCYGYWIREGGREGPGALTLCRVDLGLAYAMTAVFGVAMLAIGSRVEATGTGAGLIVSLADELEGHLGRAGRWAFLLGAWGAVFSSLFGVWQSVPYLFADFLSVSLGEDSEARRRRVATTSGTYRLYLYGMALVPLVSLWYSFREVQKYYAVFGACFMPLLALVLLYLNGRRAWVGKAHTNRVWTVAALVLTLAFFAVAAWFEVLRKLSG